MSLAEIITGRSLSAAAKAAGLPGTAEAHIRILRLATLGEQVIKQTGARDVESAIAALGAPRQRRARAEDAAPTPRVKPSAADHDATCTAAAAAADRMAAAYRDASVTDSSSTLIAAENAGDEAAELHAVAKASCRAMRGVASPASKDGQGDRTDARATSTRRSPRPSADLDDETGLAARAAASGVDVETRRLAEENQRRSAAREQRR